MVIDANEMHYTALNAAVRQCGEDAEIFGCVGQRYLGAATVSDEDILEAVRTIQKSGEDTI